MKKMLLVVMTALMLCGCQARQTFENVEDVYAPQQEAERKKIMISLPEDAILTMADTDSKLYFCDGYEIMVETFASGDLSATIRDLTGFEKDNLTIMETKIPDGKRYECVWSGVSEAGDMIGRAVIIDDGAFHYCLSIVSSAGESGALQQTWSVLTASFCV